MRQFLILTFIWVLNAGPEKNDKSFSQNIRFWSQYSDPAPLKYESGVLPTQPYLDEHSAMSLYRMLFICQCQRISKSSQWI